MIIKLKEAISMFHVRDMSLTRRPGSYLNHLLMNVLYIVQDEQVFV